ncbi:MAG: V-type ATP synthase subunit D [Peptococcia bacterium]
MAVKQLAVNPTRMELTRLKQRLVTSRRGHKLLKDKRDELMRQFLELVRRNKELREQVEAMIMASHKNFQMAAAVSSPENMREALMYPKQSVELSVSYRNVMSVNVPKFSFQMVGDDPTNVYPYGYAFTSGELDASIEALSQALPLMLELAEMEKGAQMLAQEIERTRRRVNALEHVIIPQLEVTIKAIRMKLDENERGNLTRLMKVKDMILEEARQEKMKLAADGIANYQKSQ